ncbi:MAG: hypothetical protein A3F11_09005 [Gammaproteobacteria bacterium RIFCSPHIGHO2_12_FULL_37_14]|nr:MAG: hypothetical protein A3F11_09005 [Gammaproteobacteria bacterium RIFCSPHIGHO2_12_FULL_37_14]
MSEKVRIKLSYPTVFPDLNKLENLKDDHARDYLEIERMRYGHIKEMQQVSPEQQTHWAIKKLTRLSDHDIDQLYTEDAAEVTKVIFSFIEKYFTLAKKMWSDEGNGNKSNK